MCTLSFIPKAGGYLIGMNRDELRNREIALLPAIDEARNAAYPQESNGGTWIGANSSGVAFALLNQNPTSQTPPRLISRGMIIPSLLSARSPDDAYHSMHAMNLAGMLPFLLAGFFPNEMVIVQLTWNSERLSDGELPWDQRHWFSSGLSDRIAQQIRGTITGEALMSQDAGSLSWLRKLHTSHEPAQGSFSICVHRSDASSVSYTEIACDESLVKMSYHKGQPCVDQSRMDAEIALPRSRKSRLLKV